MISKSEVLMGREVEYPLTSELLANLDRLLAALNQFRKIYGKPMVVSSGYRPGKYNTQAGGAAKSCHLTCEACDFSDSDGNLAKYLLAHPITLETCGLYMEDPKHTPGWVHLQTRPTRNRVFIP